MRTQRSAAVAMALVMVSTACGGTDVETTQQEPATVVEVDASEYTFFGFPSHIRAGRVEIEMANTGAQVHELTVWQLTGGHTGGELRELLSGDKSLERPSWAQETAAFVGALSPERRAGSSARLSEGTYAVVCTLPGSDGTPHVARGMVAEFTAVADEFPRGRGGRTLWRPEPTAKVIYRGDTMTVHDVEARTTGIEFFNYSRQPVQKFFVAELKPGTTPEQLFDELRNGVQPRSATFLGGTAALATSGSRRSIAASRMDEDRPRYVAYVEPLRYGVTYAVFGARSDGGTSTYATFRV